ncbi:MAG: small multi-drug export protein [Candidatus Gracilibacteria bacterium]|nr:small multi-drug export protein [Candidatus Gracilibacteria bacterium]
MALLKTGLLATLPLVEQRLAIPMGYFAFGLSIWTATGVAILFNTVSVAIVLWLWPKIAALCARHLPFFDRILQKIFARTRAKNSRKMKIWGAIFLIFFVAVPLPGSGGWSGSLVAWLFGVPYWQAMRLIALGLVIGGIVVAGLTVGVDGILNLFSEVEQVVTP